MTEVGFAVLGPLTVAVDGQSLTLRSGLQRRLLGLLLSRPNQVISADCLADELWNADPPPSGAKTLQSHIVRLRDSLGPYRERLETRAPGYRIVVDADSLDALRFEDLLTRGRRAIAVGAPEAGAAMLAEALALWHGTAYADLPDCEALAAEIARLTELRRLAVESRVEADLACGQGAELVAELQHAVAEQPEREQLRQHLATALFRAGRQADALAAIDELRRYLRDEYGVDPSPGTQAVELAVLRQDPALLHSPAPAATTLAPELTLDHWPLVGRDADLAWLRRWWEDAQRCRGRLVVVTGRSGIGRSRLVAEFARDLSSRGMAVLYGSGRGGADALATALGLRADAAPAAVAAAVGVAVEQRPALIVLDDVEPTPDGLTALAAAAALMTSLPVLVVAVTTSVAGCSGLIPRRELGALPDAAIAGLVMLTVPTDDRERVLSRVARLGADPQRLRLTLTAAAEADAQDRLAVVVREAAATARELAPVRAGVTSGVLEFRSAKRARAAAEDRSPPETALCPYKGLARYDVGDAEYFVGRERLTAQLVGRLAESEFIALVGASGSGKSSLARAGLLAALREGALPGSTDWRQVVMTPGSDPVGTLAEAVAPAGAPNCLVVLVDQFEELFTTGTAAEPRRTFVADLLALHAAGARIVLTLRADYYGHCAAFPDLARRLDDNSVLVGPLTEAELGRVVEVPAVRAGLVVGPGLSATVVADVGDASGALPLVSTALLRTWENRAGRTMSVEAYQLGGGIGSAVERLGEGAYASLDPAAAAAARRILVRLADPGPDGTTTIRRRVPRAEFAPEVDEATGRALDVLAARRLVTVGDGLVEITHERLFTAWPRLRAWLAEDAVGRSLVRHLAGAAADWQTGGREPGELYRGTRLQAGLDWLTLHGDDLTGLEQEFLRAGAEAAERERRETTAWLTATRRSRRRLQRISAVLAVVLVVALVAGVAAVRSRGEAEVAAKSATDAALVADADRLGALGPVAPDLDRALLLAVAAVRLHDSPETRSDLLATLLRSPAATAIIRPSPGNRLLNLDQAAVGGPLLVGDNEEHLMLVDPTKRVVRRLPNSLYGGLIDVARISPDGRTAAVVRRNDDGSWAELNDLRTGSVTRLPDSAGAYGLGWSPVGRRLVLSFPARDAVVVDPDRPGARLLRLAGSVGQQSGPMTWLRDDAVVITPQHGRLGLWSARTGRRISSGENVSGFGCSAASPDGRTLAVASGNDIRLYDAPNLHRRAVLTGHLATVLGLDFSPDGRWLASVADDRQVIQWDVRTGTLAERLSGHAGKVTDVSWSPDSRTLWTVSLDGSLMGWDIGRRSRLAQPVLDTDPNRPTDDDTAGSVAFARSGRGVTAFADGTVQAWDAIAGRRLGARVRVSAQPVYTVAMAPDGRTYATGDAAGHVTLRRLTSGAELSRIDGLSGSPVTGISYDSDGRRLLVGTQDHEITLVDPATDRPTGSGRPAPEAAWRAPWSPDGRTTVLTSGDSATVTVWSVAERRALRQFAPSDRPMLSAAFSPDGSRVALGAVDGNVRFYDTATWQLVGQPVSMAAGYVVSLAFSPDGQLLVTGGTDGTVRLLDVATGKPLGPPLPGRDNHWVHVGWPTAGRIVAGFLDGPVWTYDVDPAAWIRRACAVAGRQLTTDEWAQAVPGRVYQQVC